MSQMIPETPDESNDERILREAGEAFHAGEPISDLSARVVANAWHGGMMTALYALASTGSTVLYLGELDDEDPLDRILREIDNNEDATELHALRNYVTRVGPRGPQDGWSNLSW